MCFDMFISHANEDKDDLVSPLATQLNALGIHVLYEEFTLKAVGVSHYH
tara:strand:+ start:2870 stop:3016 length:147 start_codon:yes stop_codon:yes gene_type:complete